MRALDKQQVILTWSESQPLELSPSSPYTISHKPEAVVQEKVIVPQEKDKLLSRNRDDRMALKVNTEIQEIVARKQASRMRFEKKLLQSNNKHGSIVD